MILHTSFSNQVSASYAHFYPKNTKQIFRKRQKFSGLPPILVVHLDEVDLFVLWWIQRFD